MITVDARGHQCPVPSLKLRRALQGLPAGTRATLLATDPMAKIDLPFLMADLKGRVIEIREDNDTLTIIVETGAALTN